MTEPLVPPPAWPPAGNWVGWEARSWSSAPRRIPWLGLFLVLLGAVLLVGQTATPLSGWTLFLAAIAAAFALDWLVNRSPGALVPACFFGALALSGGLHDVGLIEGGGWTPLILGAGLLLAWLLGRLEGRRHPLAFWLGLILGLLGLVEIGWRLAGVSIGDLWPVILIALGLAILLRERGRTGRS